MYDKRTAYIVVHDMADIMQQSINDIIEVVLSDGTYNNDIVEVLKQYILDRNAYLS